MFTILTSLYGDPPKADASLCSSKGFPPLVDAIAGAVMIIIGATIASGTLAPGGTYALIVLGSLELAPLLHHVLSTLRDPCRERMLETPPVPPAEPRVPQNPPSLPQEKAPAAPPTSSSTEIEEILQDADEQGSTLSVYFKPNESEDTL